MVDNGSTPALAPYPGVIWVRSPDNLGFAGGNNLGFLKTSRPHILLLNNDTRLPSAAAVETLLAFLAAHPAVGAAQGTLYLPDGTLDACGERLTGCGLLFHRGYRERPGALSAQPAEVLAGKGAFLMLRRSAIEAAGGLFRADFFCYYEDVELCHRLWLAGYEVWYVPTVGVWHDEGSSARRLPARRIWQMYLSNMWASARSHWGWRAWLRMGPGFLLAMAGACLLRGFLPKRRAQAPVFQRQVAERNFLPRVTERVTWRYYFTLAKRFLQRRRQVPEQQGE